MKYLEVVVEFDLKSSAEARVLTLSRDLKSNSVSSSQADSQPQWNTYVRFLSYGDLLNSSSDVPDAKSDLRLNVSQMYDDQP